MKLNPNDIAPIQQIIATPMYPFFMLFSNHVKLPKTLNVQVTFPGNEGAIRSRL